MRRGLIVTVLVFGIPAIALAHVTVRPRESKAGAEERYTVREIAVAMTNSNARVMPTSGFQRAASPPSGPSG